VATNSAGSVTSAPAALLLDSDGDGLPDSWEMANFGNTTSQLSEGDPDNDGVSNLDEFLDGTDPMSNTSLRPRLIAYSDGRGAVTVAPMKLSYDLGETITLTAMAFAPSVFVGWVGDLNSSSTPADLTMDGNKTVKAKFASVVPLPPGLVAFWRGEIDASDLIGGHHGTFIAGTTLSAPSVTANGKVGGAFKFDGTLHVQVPDALRLHPPEMTLEAWIFPTVLESVPQTVIARGSSNEQIRGWWIGVFGGKPRFRTINLPGGGGSFDAPVAIPLNQWTHIAATFGDTIRRLYVNGSEVASQGGQGPLFYDPAAIPVTIGADFASNGPTDIFNGRVDEVAIYDRALTSDEVAGIYNADFLGKDVTHPYFTSPSQLRDGVRGANDTQQVLTVLGTAPVSLSLSAGTLPPGMALSSAGIVSGVPSVSATFRFTVRATDAGGVFTEQLCMLRVL
jgi:hypothetical protein